MPIRSVRWEDSVLLSSLVGQLFEYGVGEDTGDDVGTDFAWNVDLGISVWWKYRYFKLAVGRSNERPCIVKLLVSLGNLSEHFPSS